HAIYFKHVGPDPIPYPDVFFGDHFRTRQTRFNFTGLYYYITFIKALYGTGNYAFITIEEVVKHLFALSITYTLKNSLLGCLSTYAAKLYNLNGLFYVFVYLNAWHYALRLG